jgi:hypothetical protein
MYTERRIIMKSIKVLLIILSVASLCMLPIPCNSASFFHATSKAFARRILAKGFSPRKFNSNARFGKKLYGSTRPSTARLEKGQRATLIKMKSSRNLTKNSLDLRNPKPAQLRRLTGSRDLRGTVKKGVIGPKLGQKIGRFSDRKGKAILYRSAKNRGTNVAVPVSLMKKHPRMLHHNKIY